MQRAVGLRLSWPRKTQPLGLRGPTCVISPRCRDPSCPISGPWLVSPLQAAFCSLLKFPALFALTQSVSVVYAADGTREPEHRCPVIIVTIILRMIRR